jgi:hypothetical protein
MKGDIRPPLVSGGYLRHVDILLTSSAPLAHIVAYLPEARTVESD